MTNMFVHRVRAIVPYLACLHLLLANSTRLDAGNGEITVESKGGVVVCVSPPAAEVGLAVLKSGGNAVDAAVAVGFAQAVTWPEAGNIGGGGFMLVCPANGKEPVVVDYREVAPQKATKEMFAKGIDWQSAKTAGVPGTVRGLELAHKKFGKKPWKDLVMPAVKLAEDGFTVNAALAKSLNEVLSDPKTTNAEFRKTFSRKDDAKWQNGDTLRQPNLGRTLRVIAEVGPDAFYHNKDLLLRVDSKTPADLLEAEMTFSNGLITSKDLVNYKAIERTPIRGTYRGFEILAPPPPSSGGITLIETLNILENFEVKKHPWNSPETTHLVAEAMRRAFCDRARYLGDPDFTKFTVNTTTKEYAKKLIKGIDLTKATRSDTLAPEIELSKESNDTTHFSIIDKDGMAVSNTYTLENAYGCRVVVRGAGYILNNEMTDFNPRPGVTTRTGIIGTEPNQIAPGKRMLSSMCPTIVLKDNKPILITGSPGGRTIINTVLGVVVNTIDYEAGGRAAIDAPRLHHQWFPDRIVIEERPDAAKLSAALKMLGHTVAKSAQQGDAHTIRIDPKTGMRTGIADHRRDGKALGEQ